MRLNQVVANARDDVTLECWCPREIKNVAVILILGGLLELAHGQENAQRMRSAQVRGTPDERDARRQENAERMRTARRRRQDASRPEWAYHLRVHARPSPRAIRLRAIHLCSHCGARMLCGETVSLCCANGRITTTPLPTLPEGWEEMFRTSAFRTHSRQYNNLFAFTAMGVSGDEGFVHHPAPSCVKIRGCTYHRDLPAEMQGPVHWYVHDPDQ